MSNEILSGKIIEYQQITVNPITLQFNNLILIKVINQIMNIR